ncbi:2-hydroxyacid dehydrogenase [Aidingimonas halophila]|uniref:Phosphogluconate 2-dehydrogenase n=1 Tax=Aidingimonas halophila TaxID=574349 RepID=A0A1H3CVH7_9GAMM|nr:D-glycerate dehydrogenase [Aidingimonas halophila]GHC39317.1 bifunctional glyoxylate/hydroxypyruvate reductase B [Aidingimonas halophila]SDX57554.1 phosphogluconate 2-dehydrogenase [Aidingimonas halophila]
MRKRVVAVRRLHAAHLEQLKREFYVDHFPDLDAGNAARFREALYEAHGLIGGKLMVTPQMLDDAPNLEVIATISVGYDNFPVEEMTRRGILLCNTPDVLTETTADTGFALIMAAARRVPELDRFVRQGHWQMHIDEPHFGRDVHGKTLGLIGMGRIGAAVARRGALGFGMSVVYSNASPKPHLEAELGAQHCSLNELLECSDFVCVTVPLTNETRHLIGRDAFRRMQRSAILINIARGPVVEEGALIQALQEGWIAGAGLDVYEREPLAADSPLLQLPQVVALPHIGSATHETRAAMAQCAVDNLLHALRGERPPNSVNGNA